MSKKKKITIETLYHYRLIGKPWSSFDGTKTAFWIYQAMEKINGYEKTLCILEHETMTIKTVHCADEIGQFYWCPDGRLLAVRKGWLIDIQWEEDKIEFLFEFPYCPERLVYIDSNRAVFTSREKEEEKDYIEIVEIPYLQNGSGFINSRRNRLFLLDLTEKRVVSLTENDFETVAFEVINGQVFYAGNYEAGLQKKHRIFCYNWKEKTSFEWLPENLYYVRLFARAGEHVLFAGTKGEPYGKNEYDGFYEILPDGTVLPFASYEAGIGENEIIEDLSYGGGPRYEQALDGFYFVSTQNEASNINVLCADGSIRIAARVAGSIAGFTITSKGIIVSETNQHAPCELWLYKKGKKEKLSHLNDWLLNEYYSSIPKQEEITSFNGRNIRGFVMQPYHYEKGKKYPAILAIHGGPRMVYSDIYYHEMQMLAAAGYFIFFCNPQGSAGRGNEFADIRRESGKSDYQQIMEFTDYILEKYEDIDTEQVGVMGGSYGGFMVNWILGHTDRFRAAISQRSISNWITTECLSDIGYYYVQEQAGSSILEDPEFLWKASPLAYADQIKTPALFIHSVEDYRCPVSEAMQMYYVMKRRQIPAKLLLFKKENHALAKTGLPSNRIVRLKEMLRFMDRYLKKEDKNESEII